jgi:L-fuculose-phosphate aldolase
MISSQETALKQEIISVGKRLYETGLAVAKSGNISARIDEKSILITATGTSLGNLKDEDIVTVDLGSGKPSGDIKPSSELPLHALVYKNFPAKVVVHCHPPLINGYFAVTSHLKASTFETKFYLGEVPLVKQETPTVTQPELVINALKQNNLVVLKNHGTVAIADKFEDALSLTEALEEAVKSAAISRLFDKDILDELDTALKDELKKQDKAYEMFSKEHIQAIVDLVNSDPFIAQKGGELDLTLKFSIKLDGNPNAYTFDFVKGKIHKIDFVENAPFIFSGSDENWRQIFSGRLDSFVSVTQGKMKLEGQLGQLSKWYVPFTRLFALFKEVKIK